MKISFRISFVTFPALFGLMLLLLCHKACFLSMLEHICKCEQSGIIHDVSLIKFWAFRLWVLLQWTCQRLLLIKSKVKGSRFLGRFFLIEPVVTIRRVWHCVQVQCVVQVIGVWAVFNSGLVRFCWSFRQVFQMCSGSFGPIPHGVQLQGKIFPAYSRSFSLCKLVSHMPCVWLCQQPNKLSDHFCKNLWYPWKIKIGVQTILHFWTFGWISGSFQELILGYFLKCLDIVYTF